MFELEQPDSGFEFQTEQKIIRFGMQNSVLGIYWNQESKLIRDKKSQEEVAYFGILRRDEESDMNIFQIFDSGSDTSIYSTKFKGIECAEISFSVIERKESSTQTRVGQIPSHEVVVIILDQQLRIHLISNSPKMPFPNKILPIYANLDLYNPQLEKHVHALKIDLVPRLSLYQTNYLSIYFDSSENMLNQSFKRVILLFSLDPKDGFLHAEKMTSHFFDLSQEFTKHESTAQKLLKLSTSFGHLPESPDEIKIITKSVIKNRAT